MPLTHQVTAAFRNAFLSSGARTFGWPLTRDYLRFAWRAAARWGDTGAGVLSLLGFTVPYPNQMYALFLLHEIFINSAYAFRRTSDRPRIIDCGANIGMAVVFFKAYAPGATITAIEADPSTFRRLQALVAANQMTDVTVINAAVGDADGEVTFYTGTGDGSLTASVDPRLAGGGAQRVRALRVSSIVDGPIEFLKLDVEGAEYAVVRDLDRTGRLSLIRELVVECHASDQPDDVGRLIATLERNGMTVSTRSENASAQMVVLHAERRDAR